MEPKPLCVSHLLTTGTIVLRLRSGEREKLLAELIGRIPGIHDKPQAFETLLHAVVAREEMHSTAIDSGIAIPHARNAIPGLTDRPVIVFGRHPEGVKWGSMDGAPVTLFFLLIAPRINEQLQILACLSRLLRKKELRSQLLDASRVSDVLHCIRREEES